MTQVISNSKREIKVAPKNVSSEISSLNNDKVLRALCVIAVFCSSIIGARVFGLPLNTLALMPLLLYLLIRVSAWSIPTRSPLLWFYAACVLASFVSLFRPFNDVAGYDSSAISFIVQILVICVPMYASAREMPGFSDNVKKALVLTCRIQAVWGLIQYVLWTFLSFDLNNFFFCDCLGGLGKESWTPMSHLGNGNVLLRVSGLNSDGAFLGLLLVIGMVLDRQFIGKCLYVGCLIISGQRSAIVAFLAMGLFACVLWLSGKPEERVLSAKQRRRIVLGAVAFVLAILVALAVPSVRNTLMLTASRFDFLTSGTVSSIDGTYRHLLYLPATFEQLVSSSPDVMLFGVGPRTSSVIFTEYDSSIAPLLTSNSYEAVWAIESDFAGVFAGSGIIGGLCYLLMYLWFWKRGGNQTRLLVMVLFVYGLMYNFSLLMISQLLYIALACDCDGKTYESFEQES